MRRPASRSGTAVRCMGAAWNSRANMHGHTRDRTWTWHATTSHSRTAAPQPPAPTTDCRCRRCRCCHCCHCSSCRCSCHCCSLLPVTRRWKRRKSSAKHGPLRVATSIARCFAERGPNFSAPIGPPQADRERSFSAPQAERKFHRYLPRRSSLEQYISRPFCASKIPVHTQGNRWSMDDEGG